MNGVFAHAIQLQLHQNGKKPFILLGQSNARAASVAKNAGATQTLLHCEEYAVLDGCAVIHRARLRFEVQNLDVPLRSSSLMILLRGVANMVSVIPIYTGFWIDRSFDSTIYGATLTLPVRDANYLVTFLALLVTICASFFWVILAFILHQILSREGPTDVVGIQIQVALRNAGTPIAFIWEGIKILSAWRERKVTASSRRILVVAIPVFIFWISFLVASIFVAEVASKDYRSVQVLAKEGFCGILELNPAPEAFAESNRKLIEDTVAGRQYAKNWYGSNTSSVTAQTLFPATRLPYTTDDSTNCLWDERCVLGPSGAFSLQTELLDSHTMLGINARREDRITYRKNVTCSVVRTVDMQKRVNDSDPYDTSGTPKWIEYHMGPTLNGTSNVTYRYFMEMMRGGVGYVIDSLYWRPGENSTNWSPIAPFNRSDSDLSIFWLSQNSIEYDNTTLDPLFFANGSFRGTWGVQGNYWVNVMACADKHQFCNPTTNACAGWGGWESVLPQVLSLGFNPAQLASSGRFFSSIVAADTVSSVKQLGASALLAQERLDGSLSIGLPHDQWQLEVTRWFETSLAKLQSSMIQYAQNDVDPEGPLKVLTPSSFPDDPKGFVAAMESQCSNQRIQSSGQVQSFSVLGLFLVVCITFVVGLIATFLEKLVSMLRNGTINARDTALQADDSQHLLRMVLQNEAEDHDMDHHWESSTFGVPVCDADVVIHRPTIGTNRLANYRSNANMPTITTHMTK